jgi:hypothetical protein
VFHGTRHAVQHQIGNAVPVPLRDTASSPPYVADGQQVLAAEALSIRYGFAAPALRGALAGSRHVRTICLDQEPLGAAGHI